MLREAAGRDCLQAGGGGLSELAAAKTLCTCITIRNSLGPGATKAKFCTMMRTSLSV